MMKNKIKDLNNAINEKNTEIKILKNYINIKHYAIKFNFFF